MMSLAGLTLVSKNLLLHLVASKDGLTVTQLLSKESQGQADKKAGDRIRQRIKTLNQFLDSIPSKPALKTLPSVRARRVDRSYRLVQADAGISRLTLEDFWRPYRRGKSRTVILINEFLVLISGRRFYLRDMMVNEPGKRMPELEALLKPGILESATPAFVYTSGGDVKAALAIQKHLNSVGRVAEIEILSGLESYNRFAENNMVIIGNTRANPELKARQRQWRYQFLDRDVLRIDGPQQGALISDQDQDADVFVTYGIITKIQDTNRCVTLVCTNHGQAAQAMAAYVTDPAFFDQVTDWVREHGVRSTLREFQVLVEVTYRKITHEVDHDDRRILDVAGERLEFRYVLDDVLHFAEQNAPSRLSSANSA